jgi:hypothetical protein
MALNFPDNPSLNDIYEDSTSGFSYQWNGTIWKTYVANSLSFDENDYLRSNTADTKTSGDLTFSDDVKLKLGTGDDLQIYHNGSNSYIDDGSGTGALIFKSNTYSFRNAADNEQIAMFNENGSVELYYDNSKKIETTTSGVTVTGTLAATAVTGDGSALTGISAGITTGKAIAVTMILG